MARPKSCTATSRSDLLSLLSQACEFEHGLACSYLFTSFSLKQEISEGLDFRQQQLARRWAADIFAVAAEEMLHLAQVWNLLAAVGGNPYYWRPNFPVISNYYPTGLPITLAPFRTSTLERFVQYELPDDSERKEVCQAHGIAPAEGAAHYGSVAELYTIVGQMIEAIPEHELFIGVKQRQVGSELADFPTLIKVVDRETAIAAVELIKEQGEGMEVSKHSNKDPLELLDVDRDGHFGVFVRVLEEFRGESERSGPDFQVVRDVIDNPVAKARGDYGVELVSGPVDSEAVGNVIQDAYTREVAELFDRVYLLMLRLLQYVFRNSTDDSEVLRSFAKTAIGLMPTLIKPLAEALTLLPMGGEFGDKRAGPAFGLSRHVTLPEDPRAASIVVQERLSELVQKAQGLATDGRAPVQLANAVANLEYWKRELPSKRATSQVSQVTPETALS